MPEEKKDKQEQSRKLNKDLDEKKREASQYRKQFENEWIEYERFYYGDHWRVAKKRPSKNWVFSIVESEIPVLTDSRPGTDVLPLDEESFERAKMLEAGIHSVYDREHFIMKDIQATRACLITGTGWLYTDYDPDKDNGDGNIVLNNMDWRHVWVDPKASLIDEADYVIVETPMSIEDAKRKFPKFADKFKSVKANDEQFGINKQDGTRSDRWSPEVVNENPKGKFEGDKVTALEEFWLKDYTLESIPEEDSQEEIQNEDELLMNGESPQIKKWENHEEHVIGHTRLKFELASELTQIPIEEVTQDLIEQLKQSEELGLIFTVIDNHIEEHKVYLGENPEGKRPKYDQNLRLIIRFEKEIIFDGSAPERDGLYPINPTYCYKAENSIYGIGEVKNILHSQKTYNELDYAELQNLRFTSNSGWVVDDASGVDTDTLSNKPGIVIKKKTGTEVRRIDGGVTNPQLAQRKLRDQKDIQDISGVTEATQGDRPKGIVAAQAVEALQRQSIGRIRLKSRMKEFYTMVRQGTLIASRIINHWSTEKKLRVYDNGGRIQFVEFDPSQVEGLEYEVRMVPGTVGGMDKEAVHNVMLQLLQLGAIDAVTFFETTDLPYKGTLIDKSVERDELTQQAQALAQENEELKAQLEEIGEAVKSGQLVPVQQ